LGVVIRSLVFTSIKAFIYAAVVHVCLMLFGGAKRSFETTFRAVCYGTSSVEALQVIPIVGMIAAIPWSIVVSCLAIARSHETDTWRAVLAVLLPWVLCIGAIGLGFVLLFSAASSMHGWH
jgi:hypothetical protein